MRIAIVVPDKCMPLKDPDHPCACQERPVYLGYKTCYLRWRIDVGAEVKKDEIICEGEVEKKTFELPSPCDGILAERCFEEDDKFTAGDTLGYIEGAD